MQNDSLILLPSQLNVVKDEAQEGIFEVEGLYPGYGHTLGNSLRRIILSSLPGSAVTLVKVEGAEHEYSTLSGVKEDVLAILLNLKRVRFRSNTDEAQVITLKVKGDKIVTAADIDGAGVVEVLNPEQHIAEITAKSGELNIELTIERGVGFVPREMLHKDKMSVGTIAVDAIYTPIRKVSYEVENMRVGDRTDHNRLRLNIQTDGTITPREALEESIRIMMRQMGAILNLSEEEIFPPKPEIVIPDLSEMAASESEEDAEDVSDVLKTRIESLDLSTRTSNALADANIRTVGGLVKKTEEDLLNLDGLGNKGLDEIKEALTILGLTLKS